MSLDLCCSTSIATVSFLYESSLGARGKMSPGGAGRCSPPGAPYIVQPRGHGERYSTNTGELSGSIQRAYAWHPNSICWHQRAYAEHLKGISCVGRAAPQSSIQCARCERERPSTRPKVSALVSNVPSPSMGVPGPGTKGELEKKCRWLLSMKGTEATLASA